MRRARPGIDIGPRTRPQDRAGAIAPAIAFDAQTATGRRNRVTRTPCDVRRARHRGGHALDLRGGRQCRVVAVREDQLRRADRRLHRAGRAGGAIEVPFEGSQRSFVQRRDEEQRRAVGAVGVPRGEDRVALVREVDAPARLGGVPPEVGEVDVRRGIGRESERALRHRAEGLPRQCAPDILRHVDAHVIAVIERDHLVPTLLVCTDCASKLGAANDGPFVWVAGEGTAVVLDRDHRSPAREVVAVVGVVDHEDRIPRARATYRARLPPAATTGR